MSLGIFDSLLDKLFSTKGIDIPLSKKFTGSQNLMSHSYSYQNIPPEYKHSFNGNDCVNSAYQGMTGLSLDSKMDLFNFLESSANKLVTHASKLFYPPNSAGLNIKDYSDMFPGPAMYINPTIGFFELGKQHCESYSKSKMETVNNSPEVDRDSASSPKKMRKTENDTGTVPTLERKSTVPDHKQINNQVLNQELKSRKAKELQKRSKKRRRRQKKNTKITAASTAECKVPYEPSRISPPTNGNRDIFCDILLSEEANSVQILIPSFSSFVISVESDDSEWESGSDCDWLAECPEFQFSGLFITNLTSPQTCPLGNGRVSNLNTSFDSDEELEIRQLKMGLQRVNECWAEATKGLEEKPKMPIKVSFAPDDQLVQTVHVDFCERKGEWEMYATERLRFKRRIKELESILSPCLSREHRRKVFQKLHQAL